MNVEVGADGLGTDEAAARARLAAHAPVSERVDIMAGGSGTAGPYGAHGEATVGLEARPVDGVKVQINGGVVADSNQGVGVTANASAGGRRVLIR